jgi:hypothetical protein
MREFPEDTTGTPTPDFDPQELCVDGFYYRTNKWGRVVDNGKTTDPFEHGGGLYFSLLDLPEDEAWDGDDHIDFDFLPLEQHVAIHAVIDCDSGGFVEDFGYGVVRYEEAIDTLQGMMDEAWEWFGNNHPEHFDKVDESDAMRVMQSLQEVVFAHGKSEIPED